MSEYENEVSNRSRSCKKRVAEADTTQEMPPSLPPVSRRDAASLSLAECRTEFISKSRAIVITGLGSYLAPGVGVTQEEVFRWLADVAGNKLVGVYQRGGHLGDSFKGTGASQEDIDTKKEPQVDFLPLGEYLDAVASCEDVGSGRYLYDLSIPRRLPILLEHICIPRYFAHDYLARTMYSHAYSGAWPSLFIGEAETHSTLHLDQWNGHFWMVLLCGRKRWTLFHPDDMHLLYPSWERGSLCPAFPDLREMEGSPQRYPLLARARRTEVMLEAGDVLFVPGGTPHYVENIDVTVSYAGNFIDDSNFDRATHDIRLIGERQGEAMRSTYQAIDQVEYDPEVGMIASCMDPHQLAVSYSDFRSGCF